MESLEQLQAARNLALGDGRYYPTIIPGVLPIIGAKANASIEVQRWGADFLAETFASPTWAPDAKATTSLTVLPTLKEFVEAQDAAIVKSAVQAAACIYPLVYRHILSNHNDSENWQLMTAIKSTILRRMDSALPGVRICCVKFVQQVVLVQTPGVPADPRRQTQQDPNDISLANVPRDHPLIPYASLEAEASGLLDRLLDIIHGDHSDALLVTAALNTLGVLIQRRPVTANKILSSILNFNPLKLANQPMTPKNKVLIRSLERTTRALLMNVLKKTPDNPFNGRIHQYLERLHRMRIEAFDEASRKRPAPVEPTDGLDPAKRQRLGATLPGTPAPATPAPEARITVAPLPAGPVSFRQLFTLDPTASTASFDVQVFQDKDHLTRILTAILRSVDQKKLDSSIDAVRARYQGLCEAKEKEMAAAAAAGVEDDDEYEPDFEPEDAEQIGNRLDSAPPDNIVSKPVPDAPLAPYKLPEAPPLTQQEVQRYGNETVARAFGMLSAIEDMQKGKAPKGGFNRLAASAFDRDSWITILSRLATRASTGLEDPDEGIKSEYGQMSKKGSFTLADHIRDRIYTYIIHDWKRRLDLAISWLNEEWYNDHIEAEAFRRKSKSETNGHDSSSSDDNENEEPLQGNYKRCALRLIDGITTYIEGTDKVLIRFISEVPYLDAEMLGRLRKMAEDPERIDLACLVLQYLYMFRPPVRGMVVDCAEELWRSNDRAKPSAKKFLMKWRPSVLESENSQAQDGVKSEDGNVEGASANGALEVKPVAS